MKHHATKKFTYFRSLLFMLIVPEAVIGYFVFHQIDFFNLIPFAMGIMFLGTLWDIWAIPHGKRDSTWIWKFNASETLGIRLFDLPIEEYIFFFATGFYIVFLWEGIKMATETGNTVLYILLPSLSLWSLAAILFPFRSLTKLLDS